MRSESAPRIAEAVRRADSEHDYVCRSGCRHPAHAKHLLETVGRTVLHSLIVVHVGVQRRANVGLLHQWTKVPRGYHTPIER